jgi:hypothetical protein
VTDVASFALAGIALWLALRGLWRMWRTGLRVTPAPVVDAVLAGAALGLAVWLAITPTEVVAETLGGVLAWLLERSGLAGAWEWLVERASERLSERVDALLETLGLR